jgi:hypothetical protein
MDGGLQISWQAVGALGGVLTTGGVLQALYLRLMIKSSIADLTEKLDQRYPAVKVCDGRHRELDRRVDGLEKGHCPEKELS